PFAVLVGLFLVLGALHIYALRFTYDDAFITYRYAANLAHAHGLVYNPGERVEGYSNFLWAIVMAGVIALGGDPEGWSLLLGAACALAALGITMRAAQRCEMSVPVAGALIATSTSWAAWGTGGLETGAFMLCVTAGLLALGESLFPAGGRAGGSARDAVTEPALQPAALPFLGSAVAFGPGSL